MNKRQGLILLVSAVVLVVAFVYFGASKNSIKKSLQIKPVKSSAAAQAQSQGQAKSSGGQAGATTSQKDKPVNSYAMPAANLQQKEATMQKAIATPAAVPAPKPVVIPVYKIPKIPKIPNIPGSVSSSPVKMNQEVQNLDSMFEQIERLKAEEEKKKKTAEGQAPAEQTTSADQTTAQPSASTDQTGAQQAPAN